MVARIDVGKVTLTPLASTSLTAREVHGALARHRSADWGEIGESNAEENNFALAYGLRLISRYRAATAEFFWVVTEADRCMTTVILAREPACETLLSGIVANDDNTGEAGKPRNA